MFDGLKSTQVVLWREQDPDPCRRETLVGVLILSN